MAKWSGIIGYVEDVEVSRGIHKPKVTERPYTGDLIESKTKVQPTPDSTNDTWIIANNISIVADSFANSNFEYMKYAKFRGKLWNITSITEQYPRLILTIGGKYNGK